jgi:carboxy-terminal domain RNA polymerase II polypeptide A small phosphatase
MSIKSDKLLILDLDETLIHARKDKLSIDPNFQFDQYNIYKRPHLDSFLIEISQHFTLGIWSSADDVYVNGIVELIKPESLNFEIIWGRSKCTLKRDLTYDEFYFEKKLDKLKKKGFRLEQIIIVDDTPAKARSNYGNAVYIQEFNGDENDDELKHLLTYLLTLKNSGNIRSVEKRNWRLK